MATVGHTTEDVTKLPAWARKRIERLEAEVTSLKKKQTALAAGDTNMWIPGFPSRLGGDEPTPLPRDSIVRVELSKHNTIDIQRLTAAQGRQHALLATDLCKAEQEVADAIANFNREAAALHLKLKGAIDRYNAAAVKAQTFVTEIHEQQEEYTSERSDTWRNSDACSEYEFWMEAWGVELDTIELEPFVPYDHLMLDDGAPAFHDLPKETS